MPMSSERPTTRPRPTGSWSSPTSPNPARHCGRPSATVPRPTTPSSGWSCSTPPAPRCTCSTPSGTTRPRRPNEVLRAALPTLEADAGGEVIGSVSVRHDPMDAIEETMFNEPVDEILRRRPAAPGSPRCSTRTSSTGWRISTSRCHRPARRPALTRPRPSGPSHTDGPVVVRQPFAARSPADNAATSICTADTTVLVSACESAAATPTPPLGGLRRRPRCARSPHGPPSGATRAAPSHAAPSRPRGRQHRAGSPALEGRPPRHPRGRRRRPRAEPR